MAIDIEGIIKFDRAELDALTDNEVSFLEGIVGAARRNAVSPERAAYYRKHVEQVKAALAAADEALP